MFDSTLKKLINKEKISPEEMTAALENIVSGSLNTPDIESFLRLLQEKGETADEIAAAAKVMRTRALRFSRPYPEALDTCGTGGDLKNTMNVSTLAALVACAAGVKVAKHGNRAGASGKNFEFVDRKSPLAKDAKHFFADRADADNGDVIFFIFWIHYKPL